MGHLPDAGSHAGGFAPGAIQEFAPTCMAAVPKIWDILKKGIEDKIGSGSPVVRFLFDVAFSACASGAGWRICPILGLLFGSVKKMVGGRMKIGISGGGPISAEVQTFIRTCLAMPLVQGYALTETCCAGSVQINTDGRDGVVGAPLACVEMRLNSCMEQDGDKTNADGSPQMVPAATDKKGNAYLNTDTEHVDGSACAGRGEIWIRGDSVSLGYYAKGEQRDSLLKKTAEEFDKDGWFHTGDIGMFTPDGSVKIVDRLKNLIKLKGGEYIAVEAMETVFSTSVYVNGVNGGVMVHGDGDMDRPCALVQINRPKLEEWATGEGIDTSDYDALCTTPKAVKMILDNLNFVAKGKINANEHLKAVALISGTGS